MTLIRYQEDYSPDSFVGAFESLKLACINEPECAIALSMLARLYSINYSMELFDIPTPLEKAYEFARKGVIIVPSDQRTRTIVLLFKNELSDQLSQLRAEAERALALNPASLIVIDKLGYLMILLGEFKRGTALIKKSMAQNPYYNVIVHHSLWIYRIHGGGIKKQVAVPWKDHPARTQRSDVSQVYTRVYCLTR